MRYQNYELDPFQVQAVEAIDRGESLIVAAPTGCGKTLIAEYAVDVSMERNKRVIYTAPIKALSNQKYRDFRKRFGEEVVGIQTGDVTINPEGKLLIMTTEIFRNLILEDSCRLTDIYYVIFDEIHYLDDPSGARSGRRVLFWLRGRSVSCVLVQLFPTSMNWLNGWGL